MKKYIYILCVVLMGVFASCSKSEMGGETPQSNQVTLKVATDEGLQTRVNATGVDRYVIEVYSDASYSTMANVFSDGTNRANNSTGKFTMTLDRTQAYYCLLWADKKGGSVYNITSLKAVTLSGKAAEAWHGTMTIAARTDAVLTATLTRAVSKITLKESGKLVVPTSATLKLNFDQPAVFNVATKSTSAPSARPEETISISANVDGTTTPVVLNPNNDIFVLSSVATANFTDLTFKYNEEAPFTVLQAPLKANFNTNINGHYTSAKSTNFTVTADGDWEISDNNVVLPVKVGDFYYKDKTFSSIYRANAQNPCIGIVFVVNPDGKTGKIVSLDEATNIKWSIESVDTGANSKTDGAANTDKIFALSNYNANVYPAFGWCATKNTPATAGITWYLPASGELCQLYAAMSGLKWVASGAGAGEVNDWREGPEMPNYNTYITVRTAFNNKFTTANGIPMDLTGTTKYYSSSEYSGTPVLFADFANGILDYRGNKSDLRSVRAVSTF